MAAVIEDHQEHERCLPRLQRAHAGSLEFLVAAHSLAELFAVLSTYPARPRISPDLAARLIRENVASQARTVALAGSDYEAVVREMAESAPARRNRRHRLALTVARG